MSLERRTRAVAEAGSGREYGRLVLVALGLALFAAGLQWGVTSVAIAGAVIGGYVIGTLSGNPDRRYLEGFSDGLAIAPELEELAANDRRPRSTRRPGAPADMAGLPAGAGPDDPGAADGAAGRPVREAGGTVAIDPDGATLVAAFGLPAQPRQSGHPLAPDGSPVVSSGPRRSSFPAIPGAPTAVGHRLARIEQEARPAYRRQARRVRGASSAD